MTFDINAFRALYPQFSNMTDEQLTFMFDNACLISGLADSPGLSANDKQRLLFLLTCHLATLAQRGNAGGLASVTEGSVSVSYSQAPAADNEEWWYNQTPCGAAFWQWRKGRRYGGAWFCGRD